MSRKRIAVVILIIVLSLAIGVVVAGLSNEMNELIWGAMEEVDKLLTIVP